MQGLMELPWSVDTGTGGVLTYMRALPKVLLKIINLLRPLSD